MRMTRGAKVVVVVVGVVAGVWPVVDGGVGNAGVSEDWEEEALRQAA